MKGKSQDLVEFYLNLKPMFLKNEYIYIQYFFGGKMLIADNKDLPFLKGFILLRTHQSLYPQSVRLNDLFVTSKNKTTN